MRIARPLSWSPILLVACGGKAPSSPPPDTGPTAEADADADADADTDTDTDTDTDAQVDFCPPLESPAGTTVTVGPDEDLQAAVDQAAEGTTVLLEDGTYDLDGAYVIIATDGVTLRGASGDRDAVVLDGSYVSTSILTVNASNVTIADLTIQRSFFHPIHVYPADRNIEGTTIYNVRLVDPGQQALKVNTNNGYYADEGLIACSSLELTAEGREKIRDNCYTGGIDVHQARGWEVRDNRIEGFWCSSGLSEHGIHFWTGSRDTVVERNVLVNNARGIGFGLGEGGTIRPWDDAPCDGASAQHYGGVIRNNFVLADSASLHGSDAGFDVGVGLESACEAEVLHNTVYATTAPVGAAFDYRFATTTGVLANNLATHTFRRRDGATIEVDANLENAPIHLFVHPPSEDLHLSPSATDAIDAGNPAYASSAPEDIDGQPRDATPDLGADELDGSPG